MSLDFDISRGMHERAAVDHPFTPEEVDVVIHSLQAAATQPPSPIYSNSCGVAPPGCDIDWNELRLFIAECAHLPYKNWAETEDRATRLRKIIGEPGTYWFDRMFYRVLHEGRWHAAEEFSTQNKDKNSVNGDSDLPCAVLVAGLNGIRKTTAVYQPWFGEVLATALTPPVGGTGSSPSPPSSPSQQHRGLQLGHVPTGSNSFFRQLDHMIATLACTQFHALYLRSSVHHVDEYSAEKAAIFARFRGLAEILGVLLMSAARERGMSVMLETSGRDVASLHYLEHLFPSVGARHKLLLVHFSVDSLRQAESSVDRRMLREIQEGQQAAAGGDMSTGQVAQAVVGANAGGPYGSAVLAGVQAASDTVMGAVFAASGGDEPVWGRWHTARLEVSTSDSEWTLSARGLSPSYVFVPPAEPL